MDKTERPITISHCIQVSAVRWKMDCSAGINKIHAISIADTPNDTNSQGFIPSLLTQIGSVLER